MKNVFAVASNIITPLGSSVTAVWEAIAESRRGIALHKDERLSAAPFWASKLKEDHLSSTRHFDAPRQLSFFEALCLRSICGALEDVDLNLSETALILATTKGNIEWLEDLEKQQFLSPQNSAILLADFLGIMMPPVVVSHACISGVVALNYAARLLQNERCKNVIVVGCDVLSHFVLSGFQSFQAIADEPCRPFDAARKGINLGEAVATIILSAEPGDAPAARLCSGATTNDANHISGPSRTGIELSRAITNTLLAAGVKPAEVDAISAHGTATIYNDEMEAKAFAHASVQHAPVHSLKGYLGHTLGAAGILESVLLIESIRRQLLIPSIGYEKSGISVQVNVTTKMEPARISYALKTASGFGGCNAALLWARV